MGGFAVTSPDRTIFDLARSGTAVGLLEAAVDSALRLRLTTIDVLIARLVTTAPSGSGRWGIARLDDVLFTSGGHSYLERQFIKLVRRAKLPKPQTQVVHHRDGRHVAWVDFLFVRHDLVVEVSGGRGHSSAADRARDADRRNKLQQLGRMVASPTYSPTPAGARCTTPRCATSAPPRRRRPVRRGRVPRTGRRRNGSRPPCGVRPGSGVRSIRARSVRRASRGGCSCSVPPSVLSV